MHIIAPHISCAINVSDPSHEEVFQQAVNDGYVEIYMITPGGVIKHHRLRGNNRYLRLKVPSIPGMTLPTVSEEINFLPAGKVSWNLFQQIEAFFRKVMEVKKSDVEAMIWVLWNEHQGYYLWVPDQTISKASVRYDWASVPQGSSIIVDIH